MQAMRWHDARLLPGAAFLWILAVLGVVVGAQAALAACAAVCSLVLAVTAVVPRPAVSYALLAHLGVVALTGSLLFPVLLRHDATVQALHTAAEEGTIVHLAVTLRSDPAPPSSGPPWARSGVQTMARTRPATVRIGTSEVRIPASVPVLIRSAGAEAEMELAQLRGGDDVWIRGTVRDSGGLVVLSVSQARSVPVAGLTAVAQSVRHQLRDQARRTTAHLPPDEAALVRGMSTGDTHGLGDRSEEIMQRAGISHLVAVSGDIVGLGYG